MKEQGSAALRIVAFAVALAVVLGFASVMFQFTASAEDVTSSRVTLEDGTQVPTINGFSIIGSKSVTNIMINYVNKTYGDGCIFLVAQDKSTKDIYYTRFPQFFNHGREYLYAYCPGGSDVTLPVVSSDSSAYDYIYIDDSFKAYHNGKSCSLSFYDSSISAVSPDLSNLNYYWCFTTKLKYNGRNAYSLSDIVGYSDNSGFQEAITPAQLPSAEFVSCKSAPTGYPEGVLWFEDWIKQGMQYPYFSWYIRDNGNHHSYSVKFSYNSSQVDTCEKVFNNRFYDELENVKQNPLLLFAESGVIYAASKLKWLAEQSGLLTNITAIQWKNLSYTDSFALNSDDMDFTACEDSGNKVFSVCLSDYSDIGRYFIYRADIIDNTTGQVLDTTFFCPLNKFSKGNSGYGSKIYDYGDNGDGMLDDLINNTPSVDPSIKNPFDISGDVIDNNYGGGSISDLNISDILSSLESSVNSVSVFFRFCWTLFPSQIWLVILLGLSLIIILRVLGR